MPAWPRAARRGSGPASLAERLPLALAQRQQPIRGHTGPRLFEPIGPPHLDAIDDGRGAQPDVHAKIVLGEVAAAALHFAICVTCPVVTRTRAPMALRLERVPISRTASQWWPAVAVVRNTSGVSWMLLMTTSGAVVVEIAESGAAARFRRGRRRAQAHGSRRRTVRRGCDRSLSAALADLGADLPDLRIDWPSARKMSSQPSLSKSAKPRPTKPAVLSPRPASNVRSLQRPCPVLAYSEVVLPAKLA